MHESQLRARIQGIKETGRRSQQHEFLQLLSRSPGLYAGMGPTWQVVRDMPDAPPVNARARGNLAVLRFLVVLAEHAVLAGTAVDYIKREGVRRAALDVRERLPGCLTKFAGEPFAVGGEEHPTAHAAVLAIAQNAYWDDDLPRVDLEALRDACVREGGLHWTELTQSQRDVVQALDEAGEPLPFDELMRKAGLSISKCWYRDAINPLVDLGVLRAVSRRRPVLYELVLKPFGMGAAPPVSSEVTLR